MIVILAVVGDRRVLSQRALSDVDAHAADVEGGVGAPRLDARARRHLAVDAVAAAASDELLVELVVQGAAVLIAVQRVVQPRRVQMVVRILEREQPVFCKLERRRLLVEGSYGSFNVVFYLHFYDRIKNKKGDNQ